MNKEVRNRAFSLLVFNEKSPEMFHKVFPILCYSLKMVHPFFVGRLNDKPISLLKKYLISTFK